MTLLFLRSNTSDVTLSGSREIFTPSALSRAGFPVSFGSAQDKLCSPSMGTPLLRQITLRNNGIP